MSATTPEAESGSGQRADRCAAPALRRGQLPRSKANTNFTQLQSTLEDTENKVSYARQSYNDCVLSYNNAIQTFPAVIFAGIFQLRSARASRPPRPPAKHRPSSLNRSAAYLQSGICINRPVECILRRGGCFLPEGTPRGGVQILEFSASRNPQGRNEPQNRVENPDSEPSAPQRSLIFYRMRLMAPDFRPKTSMQAPSTAENSQKCTPPAPPQASGNRKNAHVSSSAATTAKP